MYDSLDRGDIWASPQHASDDVAYHRDAPSDVLRRHQEDAAAAAKAGLKGIQSRAAQLFPLIADERVLKFAWDYLASRGGTAPGRNGHRYSDYRSSEAWSLCRALRDVIRGGSYQPAQPRIIWVAKGSGRGERPLALLDIEDRVVQRAAVLVLQPLLDPLFGDHSFGSRPKRDHLHALAAAEGFAISQRRLFWTGNDITNAFMNVPVSRLVQVIRKLLPDDQLNDFVATVLQPAGSKGLLQGGPLSPLMLGIYLRHFLGRPWELEAPQVPLILYADDLLALCSTRDEAAAAHERMTRLLLPTGLSLKYSAEESIRDLGAGEATQWLGFGIRLDGGRLTYSLTERAWRRLANQLAAAHAKSDASLRAYRLAEQWLVHRGPCYAHDQLDEIFTRIRLTARRNGFEEIPSDSYLRERFQRAFARWRKIRKSKEPDPV